MTPGFQARFLGRNLHWQGEAMTKRLATCTLMETSMTFRGPRDHSAGSLFEFSGTPGLPRKAAQSGMLESLSLPSLPPLGAGFFSKAPDAGRPAPTAWALNLRSGKESAMEHPRHGRV